jgi:hypothetical protein
MNREQYYTIGKYVQTHVRMIAQDTENFDAESLCGGCAIAAVLTHRILEQLNTKSVVVETQYESEHGNEPCYHCWCETSRYVIDPTAIQFNHRQTRSWPDVVVLPRKDYYKLEMFPRERITLRGRDALNDITLWYVYQNPNHYKEKLDNVVSRGVKFFRKYYN